ncbi:MAG: polyprenyl synthetase family protein [Caldilineaceae bacterium]
MLHNFSLIHDDIEDGDETRRHRPTLWKVWGYPRRSMLAMPSLPLPTRRSNGWRGGVSAQATLDALAIFTQTCLAITEGQHLDMSFEQRNDVTVDEYIRMIEGKTAALLGASVQIGAMIGGATGAQQQSVQQFGVASGLAFQIQDDILGIWGDPATTGKAAGNDLLRRKKSLPILHTMNHETVGLDFLAMLNGDFGPGQLPEAMRLLDRAAARTYAEQRVQRYHEEGITALTAALGERTASSLLLGLAESLLHRRS